MVTAQPAKRARLGDRLLALFGVRLVIYVMVARAFLPGVLEDPAWNIGQYHDEHNFVMHDEVARRTYVEFHQYPAWNPYFCGGMVGAEFPSSSEASPEFLLRVIYGTVPGRKLTVLFMMLLGMEGMFRWSRRNGSSAIGGLTAGVAFSCMHHFVALLGWGWVFMFNANLLPWLVLGFEVGLRKRWAIVGGGAVMAWLILGGGTYMVPYGALLLFCLFVYETVRAIFRLDAADGIEPIKWWRPGATLAGMVVVTAGLSAIKLVPMFDFVLSHPRGVEQKDFTTPISALGMLVVPTRHHWSSGAGESYVGWAILLLALFALLVRDKNAAKLWGIGAVFFLLACGEFVENAPYVHLHKLPLLSQLRFPVRMLTIVALLLATAASIGLTRIEDGVRRICEAIAALLARIFGDKDRPKEQRTGLLAGAVAAIVATLFAGTIGYHAASDVVEANVINKGAVYDVEPPRNVPNAGFKQARGNRWDAHIWPYANLGSLHCFEENKLFESPYLRGDLAQEEYGAPDTDTKVKRLSWSPHKIVLEVTSSSEGRFLVNQNHHDAWTTDVGTLSSDGGLITVRVPAGTHVVTLEYRDWRTRIGAALTLATLLAIAIRGFRRLRRRAQAVIRWWRTLPFSPDEAPAKG